MPSLRCPGCQRILKVEESHRGETVRCPLCGRHMVVPRRAEDDEPVDGLTPYRLKNEPDAPRPMPLLTGRDEEDADDEDDYRPIRRRRKRRKASGLPDFLAQWNLDKVLLVGSIGLWFVLLGLALVERGFLIGIFVMGFVLVLLRASGSASSPLRKAWGRAA